MGKKFKCHFLALELFQYTLVPVSVKFKRKQEDLNQHLRVARQVGKSRTTILSIDKTYGLIYFTMNFSLAYLGVLCHAVLSSFCGANCYVLSLKTP